MQDVDLAAVGLASAIAAPICVPTFCAPCRPVPQSPTTTTRAWSRTGTVGAPPSGNGGLCSNSEMPFAITDSIQPGSHGPKRLNTSVSRRMKSANERWPGGSGAIRSSAREVTQAVKVDWSRLSLNEFGRNA